MGIWFIRNSNNYNWQSGREQFNLHHQQKRQQRKTTKKYIKYIQISLREKKKKKKKWSSVDLLDLIKEEGKKSFQDVNKEGIWNEWEFTEQ
jgi:hypothetical protein